MQFGEANPALSLIYRALSLIAIGMSPTETEQKQTHLPSPCSSAPLGCSARPASRCAATAAPPPTPPRPLPCSSAPSSAPPPPRPLPCTSAPPGAARPLPGARVGWSLAAAPGRRGGGREGEDARATTTAGDVADGHGQRAQGRCDPAVSAQGRGGSGRGRSGPCRCRISLSWPPRAAVAWPPRAFAAVAAVGVLTSTSAVAAATAEEGGSRGGAAGEHRLGPRRPWPRCSPPPPFAFEERGSASLHLLSLRKAVCLSFCTSCWRRNQEVTVPLLDSV